MDEYEIQCNNCDWQGVAFDLESATASVDDKKYIYCPDCGSDDIEDIDED